MKLKFSIKQINKMFSQEYNSYKKKYFVCVKDPNHDDISEWMDIKHGESWYVVLSKRISFYLLPIKAYQRDLKNGIEVTTPKIVECNEKAGTVEQGKNAFPTIIYVNSNDYKKIFEEVKQLHKFGKKIDRGYSECHIPDGFIEDSKLLDILSSSQVYTEEMKKRMKWVYM